MINLNIADFDNNWVSALCDKPEYYCNMQPVYKSGDYIEKVPYPSYPS